MVWRHADVRGKNAVSDNCTRSGFTRGGGKNVVILVCVALACESSFGSVQCMGSLRSMPVTVKNLEMAWCQVRRAGLPKTLLHGSGFPHR